ncbi:DNA-directed RNA polymerase subunit delta [Bacillus sp. REN16]|uniref:DNA-directed RNA polymerase subunit delta n=1 Tax=Bacillus sp. REN16 TaxID=2887296 RepID=UPI001E5AB35F|nr:DNA-directed RNA polymerase subunit delta [Bacillus sp. REN16]MCC3356263.1 DNA-directed RNA polymerase subunit delta [Bacillus sp. REN16]
MSLDQYSPEQIKEMSMLEVAYEIFLGRKDAITFNELVDEIAKTLELSEDEIRRKVSQFYTDLNIDGRFITLGDNRWGLRTWYPYEQIDEEVIHTEKPKKKKKSKKKKDEDEDLIDFDDLDDDDLDFEEDYDEEDEDLDDVDDEDEEDEDFDDIDDEDEDFEEDDEEILDDEEYELDEEDEELEEEEEED